MSTSDTVFVGRETELAKLDDYLQRAVSRTGQVAFITGEAGSGKTALQLEFVRRAQKAHPDLVVAQGICNAQTGQGEPYLPFREILGILTGTIESGPALRTLAQENAGRVKKLLAKSGLVLMEIAPDLVKLVPVAGSFVAPASKAVFKHSGLEKRLTEAAERKNSLLELTEQTVSQELIFEQFFKLLTTMAAFQPMVLILDDMQWADASSVSLMFYLGRRLTGHRVLLIGSFRPDEVAAGRGSNHHPVDQLYAELMRTHGDIAVELRRNDLAEARQFIDSYLDSEPNAFTSTFRDALARHTNGHALFVVELMRDLEERGVLARDEQGRWVDPADVDWSRLPARIDGVLRSRLDRIADADRQILNNASVEGEVFIAEVLARLQQFPEREIVQRLSSDLSRRNQLVEANGVERISSQRISRYSFRHQLIQQYLYDQLDEVERTYLHEDIARVLETLYSEALDEIAVGLAWHYMMAGLQDKAASFARRAGELAAGRNANEEAVEHFTTALRLTPASEQRTRLELLLAREAVYGWQGKRAQQAADLREMATLADALQDRVASSRVKLRQANYSRLTGDYTAAQNAVQDAVRLAGLAGDPSLEAQGYALLGRILLHISKESEAREWLELAGESAREQGDVSLHALCLYDLGHTYYGSGQYDRASDFYRQAQALYESMADRKGTANCLLMLGALERQKGNHDDALQRYHEALATCRTLGWRQGESFVLSNLGNTYFVLGDFSRAGQCHQDALAIRRDVNDRQGQAVSLDTLGLVAQFLGDSTRAQQLYDEALAIQRNLGYLRGEAYTLTHMGLLAEEKDDLNAAEKLQQAALRIRTEVLGLNSMVVDNLAALARIARTRGETAEAGRLADQIDAILVENGVAVVEFPALTYTTLFEVWRDMAAERAAAARSQGQALIRAQVAAIQDRDLRQTFLDNGPYNRRLLDT